jgi:hypothetical protein
VATCIACHDASAFVGARRSLRHRVHCVREGRSAFAWDVASCLCCRLLTVCAEQWTERALDAVDGGDAQPRKCKLSSHHASIAVHGFHEIPSIIRFGHEATNE